jgi:hypothetical protein
MKKMLKVLLPLVLVALLGAVPALADSGQANIKGVVDEIYLDSGSLTLEVKNGELYTIVFPEGEDLTTFTVGESLLVKGEFLESGSVLAERVLRVGPNKNKGEGDETSSDDSGGKTTSAYCAEDKQDKPHPFAAKLNERYGVTEEWVMGYFCDGVGMGAIMLAIITAEKSSEAADNLLIERESGKGWGQIWKGLGLIGAEKDVESPPGHLKRPDHAGPKDKDK